MDMNNNTEILLRALDNESNAPILNQTTSKIKKMNLSILQELNLSRDVTKDYMKKLNGYMYIDEMNGIKAGAFIKWISPEDCHLRPGGIVCDIRIQDSGVSIVCKNFRNQHYQIKMEDCFVFQKLSNQERVMLSVLDHIAK